MDLDLHAVSTEGDGKIGSITDSPTHVPPCSFEFSRMAPHLPDESFGKLPLSLASPVRLNMNPSRQVMAQLPLPSNLLQSTSTPSSAVSDSPPISALPLAGNPPVLKEQLELAMVAPSDSRAVAVYCAASLGHQKAFQQAALCKSSIPCLVDAPFISIPSHG